MAVNINELVPEILLVCPGCPVPLALREIQESARAFFRKSGIWQEQLDSITTVKGVRRYPLPFMPDTDITHILDGRHNAKQIFEKTVFWLNDNVLQWEVAKGNQIRFFNLVDKSNVVVTPIPQETKAISLSFRVSLASTRKAMTLDEGMMDDWHEVISSGAKYRLMMMPEKKWTSLAYELYKKEFYSGIKSAKIRANKDNGSTSLSVKNRYFA